MSNPSLDAGDVEKALPSEGRPDGRHHGIPDGLDDRRTDPTATLAADKVEGRFKSFERQLIRLHIEARGIERVETHERHALTWRGYVSVFCLWFSVNLAAVNITLGMLASQIFELSFKDASLCAVFGSMIGSMATAYVATFGPVSGNRSMIFARYTMGWWPSKLLVLLNIIVLLGYSMIGCVITGQILSAVSSNGSMSVAVGIVVVAIITWVITTFGITIYHIYERYAFVPQLIALCILYGVSAPRFDLETPTAGDPRTKAGERLSFFSLCLSAAITYAGGAADSFVYYPERTSRLALFALSLLGLTCSFSFALIVGIGLASGIASTPSFAAAYNTSQGALIVTALEDRLGGFGRFLGVVIALGIIANAVFPTYVSGINFQILGRTAAKVPRFIWTTIGVIIYLVCALAGRYHLSEIFTNFLAVMGYWLAIWIAITIEEQVIFRRRRGYDWTAWDQRARLPLGIAALLAFLIGWAGAIICMAQAWYTGPIARLVGEYGADMGNYVGFSWAALVYPPLRWLELKKFGR